MLPWIQQCMSNKRKTATLIVGVFLAVFFLFGIGLPHAALAQNVSSVADPLGVTAVDQNIPLAGTDIRVIIIRIVNVLLTLTGVVMVGLVLYAGGVIMTANGNEDKVAEGRKIIINATIGLAIILSALGITRFILSRLTSAIGVAGQSGGGGVGAQDTFIASGAYGRVITDHYPNRDQQDVPRNVRIAVTFREAVDPVSFIRDTNNNGTFGDCLTPDNAIFDWTRDCDTLDTSAVAIYVTGNDAVRVDAQVLAQYDADGKTRTVVFRPTAPLGSSTTTVTYTVDLTNTIRRDGENTSIFSNDRAGHYVWQFTTSNVMDTTPPHVVAVYPEHNGRPVARNTLLQIYFNEPIDPASVQGRTGQFTNIIFGATTPEGVLPEGEWRISNGYTTVEFTPSQPCGRNSCGDTMYCMPVPSSCAEGQECDNELNVLVRTADVVGGSRATTFEAVPFTGVMDMAGNALDSGASSANPTLAADGRLASPHKPPLADPQRISNGELVQDNFWWHVTVENTIDRSVASIQEIRPTVDEENVASDAPVEMIFTKPMSFQSLANISLEEFPIATSTNGAPEAPWYRTRGILIPQPQDTYMTQAVMDHREFGPGQTGRFYFVSVPSTVRSINQNCFYPGRGPIADIPNQPVRCDYGETLSGEPLPTNSGCVEVSPIAEKDTGCVQTTILDENGTDARVQGSVQNCLSVLRRSDVSSTNTIQ